MGNQECISSVWVCGWMLRETCPYLRAKDLVESLHLKRDVTTHHQIQYWSLRLPLLDAVQCIHFKTTLQPYAFVLVLLEIKHQHGHKHSYEASRCGPHSWVSK